MNRLFVALSLCVALSSFVLMVLAFVGYTMPADLTAMAAFLALSLVSVDVAKESLKR